MKAWLSKTFPRIFPKRWRTRRVDMRIVQWRDADAMLLAGRELALPEEDYNRVVGIVYLELREELK